MEKWKLKQIFKELNLYNENIPYMTEDGAKVVKSDILLNVILKANGRSFKEFYRFFLRQKENRDEALLYLHSLATKLTEGGFEFADSNLL